MVRPTCKTEPQTFATHFNWNNALTSSCADLVGMSTQCSYELFSLEVPQLQRAVSRRRDEPAAVLGQHEAGHWCFMGGRQSPHRSAATKTPDAQLTGPCAGDCLVSANDDCSVDDSVQCHGLGRVGVGCRQVKHDVVRCCIVSTLSTGNREPVANSSHISEVSSKDMPDVYDGG